VTRHGTGQKLPLRQGIIALFDRSRIAIDAAHRAAAASPCHEPSLKKTHSPMMLESAGFPRGDSMPDIQTDLMRPVPSLVPSDIPAMSDEECLIRLAQAVRDHNFERLDEVARLIGRLAVTIE
jgi:hypothetical protein